MKQSQRVILGIAAAAVFLMALFPPYRITGGALPRSDGYHFIGSSARGSVDIYRWLIQYIAVATVAGITYWIADSLPASGKPSLKISPNTVTLSLVVGALLIVIAVMLYFYL